MSHEPLEREIERKVCEYAKEKGMLAYKFSSPAHAFIPDRIFIFQGYVFFIEFKRQGNRPTAPQVREHERLRKHGVSVHVIDNAEDGKHLIDTIISKQTETRSL